MAETVRTPLRRVRALGAAREGTGHFWTMRLTSLAAIPLTLFLIGFCVAIAIAGADAAGARAAVASPWVAVPLLLAVPVYAAHMRIGMEEIVIDYVHAPATKYAALILNTFFCWGIGLASAFAILKLAIGG